MRKDKTPQQALVQPRESGTLVQYAWDFNKNFWKDAKFQARWNAISRGFIIMAQGAGLVLALSAAPLAIHALSVAGGTLIAGIGALAVTYGFTKSWASLEGLCERTFPKLNPFKKIRQRALKLKLVQKIIEKNPLSGKQLLSPAKQDVLLAGVTLEGSVAAVAYLTMHTLNHVAGLAAITPASMLTVGMIWATGMAAWCAYDAVCCVKTLVQLHNKHRKAKKAARAGNTPAAPATLPFAQAQKATLPFTKTSPAFNTETARKEAAQQAAAPHTSAAVHNPAAKIA